MEFVVNGIFLLFLCISGRNARTNDQRNDFQVSPNEIEAVERIKGTQNAQEKAEAVCKQCEFAIGNILALRRSNATTSAMKNYLNKLCNVYTDWGATACKGYVDIETDTILYIIDNKKDLEPARFCAIRLQSYRCQDPNAVPWHIPLPPAPVLAAFVENRTDLDTLRILHLTDIHYDPLYNPGSNAKCNEPLCCQTGFPAKPEDGAGYWGDYNVCDMPWHSVEDLMQRIKEKHIKNIDWIYFTGDIVSHKSWTTDIQSNSETIRTIFQLVAKTFPSIKVFPILGNHESHPTDYYSPDKFQKNVNISTQWVFDLAAEEWSRWLPNDTQLTLKNGGYYTVLVRPGFRVVALNSNVCFNANLWLIYADKDPYDQLQWLVKVLEQAEKNAEKVHILSHIPPGEISCHKQWSHEFKRIVFRFSKTIVAQFNGHTHMDEFRLFFKSGCLEADAVANVAWNGASFTTFIGSNPNYRIYDVDSREMTVTDYSEYTYNMTRANQNPQSPPEWYKLYSFKDAYALPDLTLQSLQKLYAEMHANDGDNELVNNYFRFTYRDSDIYTKQGCDTKCRRSLVCAIGAVEVSDSLKCVV